MIHFTLFDQGGLFALAQVLMIDVVLAGDNAVVIGLAAARVPPQLRRKVILFGLAAAVLLRVAMALVAVRLMQIIGLTLAGGILLLWVSWRFWRDISGSHAKDHAEIDPNASLRRAIMQITLADVSMSLDNVLAVAGAARDHLDVLVIGLLMSVALMGAAANLIARLLERYRWISYVGLAIVIYVAISMIWSGSQDVLKVMT
ncbi:MAG: TerC family protein [Alphaproteobacteria bacterium]|nr:TerC family protein [Alphaproteobacteria bacterium]